MIRRIFEVIKFCNTEGISYRSYTAVSVFLSLTMVLVPLFVKSGIEALQNENVFNFIVFTSLVLCIHFLSSLLFQLNERLRGNSNIKSNYINFVRFNGLIFNLDNEYYAQSKKTGVLYQRISDRLSLTRQAAEVVFFVLSYFSALIIYVVILFIYFPGAAFLIVLSLYPALMLGEFWLKKIEGNQIELLKTSGSFMNKVWFGVEELFSLKALGFAPSHIKKTEELTESIVKCEKTNNRISLCHFLSVKSTFTCLKISLTIYLAYLYAKSSLNIETMLISIFFVNHAVLSSEALLSQLIELKKVDVRIKLEQDFFTGNPNRGLVPEVSESSTSEVKDFLRIEDLEFRYLSSDFSLNIQDLKLDRGKIYAVVGYSGSGKSTFVNLLLNLYPRFKGRVIFNGKCFSDFKEVAQEVSFQPQTHFLFDGSIKESIFIDDCNIDFCEINRLMELSRELNLTHLFLNDEGEFDIDRFVTESQFSTGELQRLSLLRALISKASIYVFDEPTASLDSVNEKIALDLIDKNAHNVCTVIVAHRLSTIKRADEILVFDEGQLVEKGNHKDLLGLNGHYRKLVNAASI